MMYFITTIQEKNGEMVDQRCVGYEDTYEDAEEIVKYNKYDICETIYNYAVIEAIPSGIYQYDTEPQWFKYNEEAENYDKCDTQIDDENAIKYIDNVIHSFFENHIENIIEGIKKDNMFMVRHDLGKYTTTIKITKG